GPAGGGVGEWQALVAVAEVVAGREAGTGAAHDHHVHVVVLVGVDERVHELGPEGVIERVALLGPVQRQSSDVGTGIVDEEDAGLVAAIAPRRRRRRTALDRHARIVVVHVVSIPLSATGAPNAAHRTAAPAARLGRS